MPAGISIDKDGGRGGVSGRKRAVGHGRFAENWDYKHSMMLNKRLMRSLCRIDQMISAVSIPAEGYDDVYH